MHKARPYGIPFYQIEFQTYEDARRGQWTSQLGLDDPDVTETRRIIELANRLAAAGCPEVLRNLGNSPLRTTPLDQTLEFARLTARGSSHLDLS